MANGVFFNPRMEGLRNISVAFLNAIEANKGLLLDCTSATGIRGIRYAKEANIRNPTLIDINSKAARNAKSNVKRNKVRAKVLNISLQDFANESREKFDIIDLDPFGSPVPYIYDALKLSRGGTILMVTATDTAVLCGAHSSACVKQYGSLPLHNHLCKEVGIRILISHIIRKAAEFNFGAEVLMSISDMHYMRVFLRMKAGAKPAYESMMCNGFGSYCDECTSFSFSKGIAPKLSGTCANCGSRARHFGPLFLGALSDKLLIRKILGQELGREEDKLLRIIQEEYETPFFYSLSRLTRKIGISSAPYAPIFKEVASKGRAITRTQFDNDGVKTDAPLKELTIAIKHAKEV